MKPKSITFILSFVPDVPGGGPKVIFIYANMLASQGWDVHIVNQYSFWNNDLPFRSRLITCVSRIYRKFTKRIPSPRKWYPIDSRIRIHFPINLKYSNVPKTRFYVATDVSTPFFVKEYPVPDSNKLYLIQDYENWGAWTDEMVRETYHYGFNNIVISRWLKGILDEEGVDSTLLFNGFDFNYFKLTIPIEKKNKFSCSALYGDGERKGVRYAIEAGEIVRNKYPQFRLVFFGVSERPSDLPSWITYYQQPDKELHNQIYNESAIFLGASLQEGWGLPVGESMMCGAAVCCTDTLGYQEMVTQGETGLICPIKDSKALASNILKLIEDDELRCKLAKSAYDHIQYFRWDNSFKKLNHILEGGLADS